MLRKKFTNYMHFKMYSCKSKTYCWWTAWNLTTLNNRMSLLCLADKIAESVITVFFSLYTEFLVSSTLLYACCGYLTNKLDCENCKIHEKRKQNIYYLSYRSWFRGCMKTLFLSRILKNLFNMINIKKSIISGYFSIKAIIICK